MALKITAIVALLLALPAPRVPGQAPPNSPLLESGQVNVEGREMPYRIRRLPVSSFPDLPAPIADALSVRGCLIPQTYQAHHPENVINASLERPGSSDWAVLCSAHGQVSLLVFFASAAPAAPIVLAEISETERLQAHDLTGVLGFNWGIDPAAPRRIREAQSGMAHHPTAPDHDCLADITIDHRTIYHLYREGAWEKVEVDSATIQP